MLNSTYATACTSPCTLASLKSAMAEFEKLRSHDPTPMAFLLNVFPVPEEMFVDPPPLTEYVWEPAPWGLFATLEKSDEHWARPLGLGRLVNVRLELEFRIRTRIDSMFMPPPKSFLINGGF